MNLSECEEIIRNNFELVIKMETTKHTKHEYRYGDFEVAIGYAMAEDEYNIIHVYKNTTLMVGYIRDDRNGYVRYPEEFDEFKQLLESLRMKKQLQEELKINNNNKEKRVKI